MIVPLVPMPSGSTPSCAAPDRLRHLVLLGLWVWRRGGATLSVLGSFLSQRASRQQPSLRRSSLDLWVRASRSTAGPVRGCGSSDTPRLESVSRSTHRPGRAWRDPRRRRGGPLASHRRRASYAGQLNIIAVVDRDRCPTWEVVRTRCENTTGMSCRPNLNREPRPCLIRTVASLARRPQFVIELSVLAVADHRPVCRCF
jgi:hypothetical protein